jgi:hypothetical protein
LAAFVMAAGCSDAPTVGPSPKPVAGPALNERKIKADLPEIVALDENGETAYVVRAASSKLKIGGAGASSGVLSGVTGEIMKDGRTASRFRAKSGEVDQQARRLVLEGDVTVTDEARGIVLVAQRVDYAEAAGRIEARGRVTVSSGSALLGPVDALWATPGLERVATPDMFK